MSSSCGSRMNRSCYCGMAASFTRSGTQKNPDRHFWGCPNWKKNDCGYFRWASIEEEEAVGSMRGDHRRSDPLGIISDPCSEAVGTIPDPRMYCPKSSGNVFTVVDVVRLVVIVLIFGILIGFVLARL